MGFRLGGTFTANVTGDVSNKVNVRWHYSANGSSGSWSGTGSVIPDTDIIDVCPRAPGVPGRIALGAVMSATRVRVRKR